MTPLGAYCVPSPSGLRVEAFAADDQDGACGRHVTVTRAGRDAVAAGREVVEALGREVA